MTGTGRADLAHGELAMAEEFLQVAKHDLAGGFARRAVSAAYYAAFHAARAALAHLGLEPKTHVGMRQLFGLHLIHGGKFPVTDARLLRHMQKDREDADYAHYTSFTEQEALDAIAAAADLVGRVRAFIA